MLCSSSSCRFLVRAIQITTNRHSTTTQMAVRVRNIPVSPRCSLIQIHQGPQRILPGREALLPFAAGRTLSGCGRVADDMLRMVLPVDAGELNRPSGAGGSPASLLVDGDE